MASKKSSANPHPWPDGTYHAITWTQHLINTGQPATTGGQIMAAGRKWYEQQGIPDPNSTGQQILQSGADYYNKMGIPNPGVLPGAQPAAGAAAAGPLPEPFDPWLEQAKIAAQRSTTLAGAEGTWQRGELQRSSGFDASGNLITTGADFNPYSQAMLMQDEFKRNKAGTTNQYAAQGQYHSGAYGRAQGRNDRLYAQGFDALKTATRAGYHGIGTQELTAAANNTLGVSDASWESLRKSIFGG